MSGQDWTGLAAQWAISLQDVTNLVTGLAIVVLVANVFLLERVVRRQQEWLGALTHRVWKLEGSPHCECQDCEVEA